MVQDSLPTWKGQAGQYAAASRGVCTAVARISVRRALVALASALVFSSVPHARAELIIAYRATHEPAANLWRYDYRLSGFALESGSSFTVDLPAGLYSDPQPLAAPAGWTTTILSGDPLGGPAQFLAIRESGDADAAHLFAIRFAWLGSGVPGPQAFTLYDRASDPIASGLTVFETPSVPEPRAAMLICIGLTLIGLLRSLHARRFAREPRPWAPCQIPSLRRTALR